MLHARDELAVELVVDEGSRHTGEAQVLESAALGMEWTGLWEKQHFHGGLHLQNSAL